MWSLLAFLLYAVILFAIGFLAHRAQKKKNNLSKHDELDSHLMGGRSLNYYVTALSAHASDMSSWIFLAFPMQIYLHGLKSLWIGLGLLLGMWINWKFVAKKIRLLSQETNTYTLNGILLHFFPHYPRLLNAICTLSLIIFTTYYLAAGLTSIGLLFDSMLGINYYVGVVLAVILVLSYTTLGGFVSVAWTDFFQAVFLLVMILLVPISSFFEFSSLEKLQEIFTNWRSQTSNNKGNFFDFDQVLLAISWGLGYFGMPHILTKFMGIQDPQEIKKSMRLGISWQFLALSGSALIGFIGLLVVPAELNLQEVLFIHLVQKLYHPFIAGFILCGVLAATISTMDSQILVLSTSAQKDLRPLLNFKFFSKNEFGLLFAKLSGVFATIIAMIIALFRSETINETVFYAWSGLGLSFGPILLICLFFMARQNFDQIKNRKEFSLAALFCILSGLLITFFWPHFSKYLELTNIPSMLVGMIVCTLVFFLTSFRFKLT